MIMKKCFRDADERSGRWVCVPDAELYVPLLPLFLEVTLISSFADQAGDKICIFGFSRGAYTARSLAGMIHKVGLLPADNHQQVCSPLVLFLLDNNININVLSSIIYHRRSLLRTRCTPAATTLAGNKASHSKKPFRSTSKSSLSVYGVSPPPPSPSSSLPPPHPSLPLPPTTNPSSSPPGTP